MTGTDLCVNKPVTVPVIFEPPSNISAYAFKYRVKPRIPRVMIAGVSAKIGTSKMRTSLVFRVVTWHSLAVGYIGFDTACSYCPQGSSLTSKDGTESLFRKFGDKTTPHSFSEKRKPLLQSSESLKSSIPNASLEQLAILALLLTYTGSELANLFEGACPNCL